MERDQFAIKQVNVNEDFNSHAHVERDDDVMSRVFKSANFNSHAHVERDNIRQYFIK